MSKKNNISTNSSKSDIVASVSSLKKEIMFMRIKLSSGEKISLKEYSGKKKEVARLLTKMNSAN